MSKKTPQIICIAEIVLLALLFIWSGILWLGKKKESGPETKEIEFHEMSYKNLDDETSFQVSEKEKEVRQSFTAKGDTLIDFTFWIRRDADSFLPEDTFSVSIRDENSQNLWETTLPVAAFPDDSWFGYGVNGANLSLERGKEYFFAVSCNGKSRMHVRTTSVNPYVKKFYPGLSAGEDLIDDQSVCLMMLLGKTARYEERNYLKSYYTRKWRNIFFVFLTWTVVSVFSFFLFPRKGRVYFSTAVLAAAVISGIILGNINKPWYINSPVIRHAGGIIDGNTYTNSKEAVENSLSQGDYYIEMDFAIAADGEIILKHDWGNKEVDAGYKTGYIPVAEEFVQTTVDGGYRTLSVYDLLKIMKKNRKMYCITDTKHGEYDAVVYMFSKIAECARKTNCEEVLDRFIIQIYNDAMLDAVLSCYPFQNIIYTMYERGNADVVQFVDYCKSNDVETVTVPLTWWEEMPELRKELLESGLIIYVHTINDEETEKRLKEEGVTSVYTDELSDHR